ncbi:MAG: cysteine desulfurase NifS [Oscillospiraceae bacterium]
MLKKTIYLDNSATTPVAKEVLNAMLPWFSERYGNPSSIFYSIGNESREAIDNARRQTAKALGCEANEIYFTGCGSEADNWAIKGTAHKLMAKGKKHIITSQIEHHAVLHSMKALEREGFEVTYLPVDSEGFVSPQDVEKAIRPDTALVSIMYANNEIGTLEPITEIGAICRKMGVWFHTDAVQAAGAVFIDVNAQNIDMLSISAHKFNGPKGVGALYIKRGIMPEIFMDGGAQENGKRAGTENVAGIVGLGEAIARATAHLDEKRAHLVAMRNRVIEHIMAMPQVKLNGPADGDKRLPGNVNASFTAAEGESLLLLLDMKGICASSGSACASGSLDPSHVLLAIGMKHELAHCSLRISFGVQNTMEDAEYVCTALDEIVPKVRERSPLWHPEAKD